MTRARGIALILACFWAATSANATGPSTDTAASGVRLKTISARVHGKGASLVIETSDPAAYVATRPDALTVVLDFRNVAAEGVGERLKGRVRTRSDLDGGVERFGARPVPRSEHAPIGEANLDDLCHVW